MDDDEENEWLSFEYNKPQQITNSLLIFILW